MSPDVLQFSCSACQNVLTVPSTMAGISGPCPVCGHIITSPLAAPAEPEPAPVPLFTTQAQPPAPPAFADQAPVPPAYPVSGSSSLGPVMPKPHSITQQLSPLSGNAAPLTGLGGSAETAAPASFPPSGFSDFPPARPPQTGGAFPGSAFGGGLPTPSGPLTNPFPPRTSEPGGGLSGFPPVSTVSPAAPAGAGSLFPPAGFGPGGGSPFPTGESTAPVPGAAHGGGSSFVLPGEKSSFAGMFGGASPATPPANDPSGTPPPSSLFVQPAGPETRHASSPEGSFGETGGAGLFPSALTPQSPLQDPSPAWQQPGLGQTLLGGLASSPSAAAAPANSPFPPSPLSGGLPPRRTEGQAPSQGFPTTGSIWGALQPALSGTPGAPSAEAFGSTPSSPAERSSSTGAPTHSSLIPGAPTLPQFGATGTDAAGGSLLSREIAPSPAGAPGALLDKDPAAGSPGSGVPAGNADKNALPASSAIPAAPGGTPRKLKKPSRSSSVLMFTLSILLLVGFLTVVGWMFRQPLVQIVKRIWPAPKAVVPIIPTLPSPASAETETAPGKSAVPGHATASASSSPAEKTPSPANASGTPDSATAAASSSMPPVPADDLQPIKKPATEPPPAMSGPDGIVTAPPVPPLPAGQEQPLPNPLPGPGGSPSPKLQAPADLAATVPTPSSSALTEVPTKPLASALQNGMSGAASVPGGEPEGSRGTEVVAPPAPKVKIQASDEARPAAEALTQFLAAGSFKERLKYTLGAEVMKPLMERYYESQPDGPVHVDAVSLVRLDPKPQMGGGAHAVFGVESRSWEYPIPVMLEETKSGFKVDWLSFVEFKDRLLEKFFEGYQEGPARFHVGITRTHYFEDRVPNAENKDAFRISPAPPNPFLTTVFVEKDSQLGRELKERIPWGAQVWAIVDLEWVKLGNQQWVQLSSVPQLNWYSVPPDAPAKATSGSADEGSSKSKSGSKNGKGKSAPVQDEVQRAVPVGR